MEEGWIGMEEEENREAQLHLSMFAVVLTIGVAGAFRGEDIPKFLDLGSTMREYLARRESAESSTPSRRHRAQGVSKRSCRHSMSFAPGGHEKRHLASNMLTWLQRLAG
jgi:succinylglutamate desuccinylase